MSDAGKPSTLAPTGEVVVRSSEDIGRVVQVRRAELGLLQLDLAGRARTGNRFIVELERGKPTLQLQKALDVLSSLGLEVVLRPKSHPES